MIRINPNPLPTGARFGFIRCGGPKGIRTLDLSDANRTLSQLSYGPREAVFFQNSFYILAQPETVVKRFYEFFPF